MRQFYMAYKDRENEIIQSTIGQFGQRSEIIQSGIGQLDMTYARLPFKLSWTHYQILMRIEDAIPQKPADILHTPYVLEFAGLEDKASYLCKGV